MRKSFKAMMTSVALAAGLTVTGAGLAEATIYTPIKSGSNVRAAWQFTNNAGPSEGRIQRLRSYGWQQVAYKYIGTRGTHYTSVQGYCGGSGTFTYRGQEVLHYYGASQVTYSGQSRFTC